MRVCCVCVCTGVSLHEREWSFSCVCSCLCEFQRYEHTFSWLFTVTKETQVWQVTADNIWYALQFFLTLFCISLKLTIRQERPRHFTSGTSVSGAWNFLSSCLFSFCHTITSATFCKYKWVQHHEYLRGKSLTIAYPNLNDYLVSPLSMAASFSPSCSEQLKVVETCHSKTQMWTSWWC